jgi:transcriptional regulator with XRE-family HTH domain
MKSDFRKAVSSELKIIRIENNDLQEELSKKSKVATSTISRYEEGTRKMNLDKIEQILKPYEITLSIFFKRILAKTQEIK